MKLLLFLLQAPQTYSEEHPEFNRTMRAHLNYLENYPFFTVTMLLGGLEFPVSMFVEYSASLCIK